MAPRRTITLIHAEADAAARSLLKAALEAEGYQVRGAATGAEAMRLAAEVPDLVLVDLHLPDMDGLDLCQRIKSDPRTASILVMYLAAPNEPARDSARRLEGGADGYLAKPLDPGAVVAQVRALLRLQEAEGLALAAAQQWRTTFDAVHDGIGLVNRDGKISRCNRALAEILQRPLIRIVGTHHGDLMRDVLGTPRLPPILQGAAISRRDTAELQIGKRWFQVSADPALDDRGAAVGTVYLYADITERKETEQSLARLAAIVESSGEAMIGTTLDGRVTNWNPAAQRLFGYAASEIISQPLSTLVPPGRAAELGHDFARIRRGERRDFYETQWCHRDGSLLDVVVTLSPLRDAGGSILGSSVIVRNITEHKRLEEQYRQSQRMEAVGRLAGGVAHDFNNLLTIILGYGQVLAAQLVKNEPALALLAEVLKAGDRAAVLTRHLLAFSRRQVLAPRVIDLNLVVTDMDKMLRRLIGEDIEFVVRLDPRIEHVRADPGQIDQVLLNLAANARDAMPGGGRLTIATGHADLDEGYAQANPDVRPGPYVVLSVSDTGSGIARDQLPHIFEPFYTTKEVGRGTGLGLSMVYGIIKQSEGHIAVSSEIGRGTTFRIYLPRTSAPVSALPAAPPPSAVLSGQETILVVEDEEPVRRFTVFALRRHRYTVLEAANGAEALRIARQHVGPIHLLVSDVVMPGMSGREVADRLCELHTETRVLYFSGYTNEALTRHGVQTGEQHFLPKPFRAETLARKVREVLDAPA